MLLNTLNVSHPTVSRYIAQNKISLNTAQQLLAHHMPLFDSPHYCELIDKQQHVVCWEVLLELTKLDCALLLREDVIEFTKHENLNINTIFRGLKNKLIDKFGVALTNLFLNEEVAYADLCRLIQERADDFHIIKSHSYFSTWINYHLCTLQEVLAEGLLAVTIKIYAARLFAIYQNYLEPLRETKDTLEGIQYELLTIAEYHTCADKSLREQLTHELLLLFRKSIAAKKESNTTLCALYEKCIDLIDACEENNWQKTLDELIFLSFSAKMQPSTPPKRPPQLTLIHGSLRANTLNKNPENASTFYSSLIKLKSLLPQSLEGQSSFS